MHIIDTISYFCRQNKTTMSKKISMALGLFALSFVLMFSSCDKDDDDFRSVSTLANVMAVHASPGSPDVDLYINDVLQNDTGLMFPSSSRYLQSITGLVNIKINKSGTAETIIDRDVTLNQNGSYSIFVIDTLPQLSSILTFDNLTEPILGKANIRLAHLTPDAPSIDVLDMSDSSVVFANRSYKQISDFIPVDGGVYDFGVRALGDTNVILLPSIQLMPGKIFTIYAKGLLSGTGSNAFGVEVIQNTP